MTIKLIKINANDLPFGYQFHFARSKGENDLEFNMTLKNSNLDTVENYCIEQEVCIGIPIKFTFENPNKNEIELYQNSHKVNLRKISTKGDEETYESILFQNGDLEFRPVPKNVDTSEWLIIIGIIILFLFLVDFAYNKLKFTKDIFTGISLFIKKK